MDVRHDQPANVLRIDVGNVEAANVAVALDKGDNGLLRSGLAGGAVLGLAADIGFIGLNNGVGATEGGVASGAVHSFTDAMAQEPRGLVGDAEHTLHLLRAHALLGSGHEVRG